MIVKVQRCIAPQDGPALVYDQHRSHQELREVVSLPAAVVRALDAEPKAYFHATWAGGFIFAGRAPAQEW